VIVRFVDIDGIVDHHLFKVIVKQVMVNNSTNINKANNHPKQVTVNNSTNINKPNITLNK
jgi:hypothetical protein